MIQVSEFSSSCGQPKQRKVVVTARRLLWIAALIAVPFVVVLVLSLTHSFSEKVQPWRNQGTIDGSSIVREPPAQKQAQWRMPQSFRRTVPRRRTGRSLLDNHNEIASFSETSWMAHLFRKEENIQQSYGDDGEVQPRIVRGQDVKTKETQTRIVGGRDVNALSRFPSFVFTAGSQLCGGTLIHEDVVLTAAHCVNAFVDGIIVGSLQIDGTGGFFAAVAREYPHPEYNPETDENDIMLVLLSQPVANVPIQMLNTEPSIPADGENVTVIGFGFTSEDGALADTLQEVQVNVVDFGTCNDYFGRIVDDIMLCAGAAGSGRDSCQGDSGGPLFTDQGLQVGLVSFGLGCARPDVPAAVYARVSSFDRFIEGGICDLASNPPSLCAAHSTNPTTSPALSNSTVAPNISPAPRITDETPTRSPSLADGRTSPPAFTSTPTTADDTASTGAPNIATPVSPQAPPAAETLVSAMPTPYGGSESPAPFSLSSLPTSTEGSRPTAAPSPQVSAPFSTGIPTPRPMNETDAPTPTPLEKSRLPNLVGVNNSIPTTSPTIFRFGGGTSPPTDGPTSIPTIAPTIFRFGGGTDPPSDVVLQSANPSASPSSNPSITPHIDIPSLIYRTNSPASASNPTRPVFDRLTQSPAPILQPSPPQIDIPSLIAGTKSPIKSPRPKPPHLDIPTLIFGTRKPSRPVFDVPVPLAVSIPSLILGTENPSTAAPQSDIAALILAPYPAASRPPMEIPTRIQQSAPAPARKTIVPPNFLRDIRPSQAAHHYYLPSRQRKSINSSKASAKNSKGKGSTRGSMSSEVEAELAGGSRWKEIMQRKRVRKRFQSRTGRIFANLEV